MTECARDMDIAYEALRRMGIDPRDVRVQELSERTVRIFTHYQKTWNRSRRKTTLYLDSLVQHCIANLAGGNGVDNSRTEVKL